MKDLVVVAVAVAAYEQAAGVAASAFGTVVSAAVAASGTVVDAVTAAVNIAVELAVELRVGLVAAAEVYYRDDLQRSKTCLKCVSKSLAYHFGQTGFLGSIDSTDSTESTDLRPTAEESPVAASCHSLTLQR